MSDTNTLTKPQDSTSVRRQPPYAVVLHNDEYNGMDFVIMVLQKVFGYSLQKAFELMMEAHVSGRSIVWSGMRELAELRAEQIHTYGPDPTQRKAGPLQVSVEPIPQ
jgi:ATP-dependent Clp protease adaptor protein ClpS